MSHELRTPLNAIIGFANVVYKNRGGELSERSCTFVSRIRTNGEHLLKLINDILDLAKVESGNDQISFSEVDLGELVGEVVDELEGRIVGSAAPVDVAVIADLPERISIIESDALRLKQIIINLVGNALKFTAHGSVTVRVVTNAMNTPVRIDVVDTGIGIPADRLDVIFQAFEQADRDTAMRYGGTGLGLAISATLAERLGHRIGVMSTVGEGSTFSVYLIYGSPARRLRRICLPGETRLIALLPSGDDSSWIQLFTRQATGTAGLPRTNQLPPVCVHRSFSWLPAPRDFAPDTHQTRTNRPHVKRILYLAAMIASTSAGAHAQTRANTDWPVYGGGDDHTHYTTLGQISPANVKRLKVAWTYSTRDEFNGSEMQANPVVVDGVLYATTPKLQVFALEAATGKELWKFDPNNGNAPTSRIRHRGVVVAGDRVIFNYRNRLYALDRRTGRPIRTFGDTGWVDLRQGLGRPVEGLSVSASTPGVVFEDLLIMGSTVPEALPSAPGDIRAFDVRSGALKWNFHTIPHPGEPGYETWPPDAWKTAGGANAWSGVTLDAKRAMVFVATGSASYDFYGANRIGDNLYANSVIAIDARTGAHKWHYQVLRHDLWDRDLPAAPMLVTITRGGKPVDAVAQITKTGHVWLFDRDSGAPLFPVEERAMPRAALAGEHAAASQRFPLLPPPFTRQQITRKDLTTRTPAAHAAALELFKQFGASHPFDTPNEKGILLFPGVDGGGEWGGPAFDPESGLLYVNANEMAWLLKLVPRSDRSLYAANCASCHGDDRRGNAMAPSLIDVGTRRSHEQIAQIIRDGTGRMPAFGSALEGKAVNDIVSYLVTGKDVSAAVGPDPFGVPYRNAYFDIFLDHEGYPAIKPPWGTLSAIDLNKGAIRWQIPFGEYPKLAKQGLKNTGTDNYGGAIVTQNGLLIIAATTYDNKIRAFDKKTGRLLWSAALPAAGNATPSTYMVNGKQYVVIACGGGKNGAPSGGTYVAFALPQ